MTRRASARLAGSAFLVYIVFGLAAVVLFGRATRGGGTAAKLASVAEHASDVRIAALLTLLSAFMALVLGTTLYGLTRDEDHELAVMAMVFRLAEGALGAASVLPMLGLVSVAAISGTAAADAAELNAVAAALLRWKASSPLVGATLFAAGSAVFSWLFVRARTIPASLAWLGLAASVLLLLGLPLQIAGLLRGLPASAMWLPMLVFEIAIALWLLIRGVAPGRPSPLLPQPR